MFEPAIKNWKNQPPAGGWPFEWTSPTGRTFMLRGMSPRRVVEELEDIQKVNKWFVSHAHTWAICNDVWRAKDPARAITGLPTTAALPLAKDLVAVKTLPVKQPWWDAKPEQWGMHAWNWLHTFGAMFERGQWKAAIERISDLLNPAKSPHLGCHKCYEEFKAILRDTPPDSVDNEVDAAAWSFQAHNRVNRKRGAIPMTWDRAAKLHHWKVSV